jgi:DHA3 family tetracycline resistance protein-like MFS transporter
LSTKRKRLGASTTYLILGGASSFFFSLIVTVNLIYQQQVAHLNPLQLVLVGTVLETTAFFTQVPTGVLADVYSRRLAIILGVFLIGAGFALEGAIPRFATILLAQVIWGVGITFVDGADSAWIADEIGDAQVGPLFVRAGQIGQIASLVSIPLSVALASIQLNLPILLGGMLYLLLGVFLIFAMPEQGFKPAPREERSSWQAMADTTRSGVRLIRQRPILLTFLGITVLYAMFSEGIDRLWIAHLLTDFGFPTLGHFKPVVWIGLIDVVDALLGIAGAEIVRRRLNMNNHRAVARVLFVFNALICTGAVAFGLAGNFFLAVAASSTAGVLRGLRTPVFRAWQTQNIDPQVRATVLSIDGQADAFGQIAGGPALGAIGTFVSLRAALVVGGSILAPALLLLVRASRQGKAAHEPVEEAIVVPVEQ